MENEDPKISEDRQDFQRRCLSFHKHLTNLLIYEDSTAVWKATILEIVSKIINDQDDPQKAYTDFINSLKIAIDLQKELNEKPS